MCSLGKPGPPTTRPQTQELAHTLFSLCSAAEPRLCPFPREASAMPRRCPRDPWLLRRSRLGARPCLRCHSGRYPLPVCSCSRPSGAAQTRSPVPPLAGRSLQTRLWVPGSLGEWRGPSDDGRREHRGDASTGSSRRGLWGRALPTAAQVSCPTEAAQKTSRHLGGVELGRTHQLLAAPLAPS